MCRGGGAKLSTAVAGAGVRVGGEGESGEEDFCDETEGDDPLVLPLGREEEVEVVFARVLDLIGVRGRGEVISRRAAMDELVVELLEALDGLEGVTLDPFRIV